MNEQGIVMNSQRWEELVEFAKDSMYYFNDGASVSDEEVMVIVSVLKNNIPFDVVNDLSNNEEK
mgnify:CR=1 FL=1